MLKASPEAQWTIEDVMAPLRLSTGDETSVKEYLESCRTTYLHAARNRPPRLPGLLDALKSIERWARVLPLTAEKYNEDLQAALGHTRSSDSWTSGNRRRLLLESRLVWELGRDLRKLEEQARAAQLALTKEFAFALPDKGGPPLEDRLRGSPMRRFIEDMVWLWACHRTDSLVTTGNSGLAAFVECAVSWATGDDDVPKGIKSNLAEVVPKVKLQVRLMERVNKYTDDSFRLYRLGKPQEAQQIWRRAETIMHNRRLRQS